jgi:phosphate starvation-inducible PhoH-like protein
MSRKTRRQKLDNGFDVIDQVHDTVHKFEQPRTISPMNESQVKALNSLRSNTLSILTGPPGTAKTLLSVYVGCELLHKRQIDKIYYVKPIVETEGEQGLGFLPGDLSEKIEPHIGPLRDSLGVFMTKGKSDYLLAKKTIEFMPIEHLRGRSLDRCMVIADEMQNATTRSVMTILTRVGNNSKIALLGDVVQRDLAGRFGKDGLSDAARRLSPLESVGHINFGFNDIVRSGFVRDVIGAYSDLY